MESLIDILPTEILYSIFHYLTDWHYIIANVNHEWESIILSMNNNKLPPLHIKLVCLSISLIKWAKESKCPWNEIICAYAAYNGQLEVLKWVREYNCPWNALTCQYAAMNGHLEILKWARQHNCPYNYLTCEVACKYGQLDIIKYLCENEPSTKYTNICKLTCEYMSKSDEHRKCLEYACKHEYKNGQLVVAQYDESRKLYREINFGFIVYEKPFSGIVVIGCLSGGRSVIPLNHNEKMAAQYIGLIIDENIDENIDINN